MKRIMRAIQVSKFGGPDVLKYLTDVDLPKVVENQVCVRVKCAGVNPADTYKRSGTYAILPTLPYTPGEDGAGEIFSCGPKVTKFKPGDRVYFCRPITGAYAEFSIVSENNTFHLHSNLTFKEGAALGVPYFTAYRALVTKSKAQEGQTVLVHGASGGVGLACCQLAKQLGLRVLGTAGTDYGMKLVEQNGASVVFNHRKSDYIEEIKRCAGSIDIIVEMLANVNLQKDLDIISNDGQILIVGCRDKVEIYPRFLMNKESKILGVQLFKATEKDCNEMANYIDVGQKQGWVKPFVGVEFKLEDAHLAHEEVIKHDAGSKGKIVLNLE